MEWLGDGEIWDGDGDGDKKLLKRVSHSLMKESENFAASPKGAGN